MKIVTVTYSWPTKLRRKKKRNKKLLVKFGDNDYFSFEKHKELKSTCMNLIKISREMTVEIAVQFEFFMCNVCKPCLG